MNHWENENKKKNIVNNFHLLTKSQRLPNMLGKRLYNMLGQRLLNMFGQRLYNMLGQRLYNMLGQRLYNMLGQHFWMSKVRMVLHRATNVGPTKIAA